jgi:hypothetical protein
MTLEMEHLFIEAVQGEPRVDFKESLWVGSDFMNPKYNLEPFYMAIFLSKEDWI